MMCEASVVLKVSAAIIFVAVGWAELLRRKTAAARKIRGATLLDISHLVLLFALSLQRLLCAQYSSGFVFIILIMAFLASATEFFTEKQTLLQV
ncbi:hypothetical protein MRX96_006984 [Rhipicephalus microplus]